jgi:hypothetical protein
MAVQNKAKGFHVQISNTFGYVLQENAIADIVRDWEIQTMSSFSSWKKDKNFGKIGKNVLNNSQVSCDINFIEGSIHLGQL